METVFQVIKRAVISEKSTLMAENRNTYVFEVAREARKQEIRQAVEKIFKVKVSAVRTMVGHGKMKRTGRFLTKRIGAKKALVTLKEGQKIELVQGV